MGSPKKINPRHHEFKTHTILKLTFQNHEREKREKPRGRRERSRERGEKPRKRSHCRGWWRCQRCMVPVRNLRGWPWKPWSDPGEKVVREREKREKMREGVGGWRKKKRKQETGWVNPTRSFLVKPYPVLLERLLDRVNPNRVHLSSPIRI